MRYCANFPGITFWPFDFCRHSGASRNPSECVNAGFPRRDGLMDTPLKRNAAHHARRIDKIAANR